MSNIIQCYPIPKLQSQSHFWLWGIVIIIVIIFLLILFFVFNSTNFNSSQVVQNITPIPTPNINPIGTLNQKGPCLTSTLIQNKDGICKGIVGYTGCNINSDCTSNICTNSVCQPTLQMGQPCTSEQCSYGLHCSVGYCQPTGIDTGREGAYCNININGLSCTNSECSSSGGSTTIGICTANSDTNLALNISEGGSCQAPLVSNGTSCVYSTPPTQCIEGKCPNGFICNKGQCLAEKGNFCNISENCNSLSCINNGAIYEKNNGQKFKHRIDLGNLNPTTISSQSIGSKDIIWILDPIYGLYKERNGNFVKAINIENLTMTDFTIDGNGNIYIGGYDKNIWKIYDVSGESYIKISISISGIRSMNSNINGDLLFICDTECKKGQLVVISQGKINLLESDITYAQFYEHGETNIAYIKHGLIKFFGKYKNITFPSNIPTKDIKIWNFSIGNGEESSQRLISNMNYGGGLSFIYGLFYGVESSLPGYISQNSLLHISKTNKIYITTGGICK